ncbi:hypothetical protein LCGC14_2281500 [marine sediment metagenome]|uniref:DUF4258 domain-containing protein n=1 Tax=marine sediment metagenome TaxID=412755 RepID=A0A0F9F6I7_9ZZZZ
MDYIEMGKLQKHPNELIEITIIKEHGDFIALVCICESVDIKERWQEYV